jgi:VWFA-related protein
MRSALGLMISGITVSIGASGLCFFFGRLMAQNNPPTFKAKVDLVVLTFTVQTGRGDYVKNLKPTDFRILEDGITQKISTFAQGNRSGVPADGSLTPTAGSELEDSSQPGAKMSQPGAKMQTDFRAGSNLFILFDTSDIMYSTFSYAEDAIADFIRSIGADDSIAVYTFSRNLFRASTLSHNPKDAIAGLRKAVAGDSTALYNGLLLTIRDAAKIPGRKVVIVFSNGPDNASMVAPDDVGTLAEDEGIPIYVISTKVIDDPVSSAVFRRLAGETGGKAYRAETWQKQAQAFASIREDLGSSYTVTYYPAPNPNDGFRKITVELVNDGGKKLRVRTRPGYRPHG